MRIITLSAVFCLSLFTFVPKTMAVGSAGFENASFSARSLGEGNAVTARPEEPAAISYNPAGIIDLPGIQVQSNMALISAITHIHNDNLSLTEQSAGTIVPVPTGYVTIHPGRLLGDRFSFGVGADSPFGLANRYNSDKTFVHYTGYVNWLKMYTIKPVAAVKVTDWLSLAGGPMYYRVYDFGAVQAYPNAALVPGLPDGQVRVNMSGNSWGWNMGALVKPHEQHQMGFYFRSPVTMTVSGLGKVENSSFGGNFETGVNAKLDLPLNFTFAYAFKPNDRSAIETDFGFTRWSIYDRLYINADRVNAFDDLIMAAIGKGAGSDRDYRNSFSLHLGGHYDLTQKFTVRGGSFFYTAAEPKNHLRPAVPDSNRLGLTTGLGYKVRRDLSLDMSYLFEFALRRHIDNAVSEGLGTTVDGTYFGIIQGLYLSLTYKWDGFCRPAAVCGEPAVVAADTQEAPLLPSV